MALFHAKVSGRTPAATRTPNAARASAWRSRESRDSRRRLQDESDGSGARTAPSPALARRDSKRSAPSGWRRRAEATTRAEAASQRKE